MGLRGVSLKSSATFHVLHDKFDTRRAYQNGTTDRPSFGVA